MTGVLQEEGDFDTETQGRLCDDGGGSWSDAATGQGMQRIIGNHLKLGNSYETFLLKACRRNQCCQSPDFRLPASEL